MTTDSSLFFVRHGKLLLPYEDHSEMPFKVLADLAAEKLDPPINRTFAESEIDRLFSLVPFERIARIYTSPSKRCQDTANFIANFINENFGDNIDILVLPELIEIDFDLDAICASFGGGHFNIEVVNEYVFKAMVGGNVGCEPAPKAYERISSVFGLPTQEGKYLFVTHDFIMRIIEIYIRNRGAAKSAITYEDLKNTNRNSYLRGFATNLSLSAFVHF